MKAFLPYRADDEGKEFAISTRDDWARFSVWAKTVRAA